MPEYPVTPENAGLRLDHFLPAALPHLSRARIQALIKSGDITLNRAATKPGAKIKAGDLIDVHEPPPESHATDAEDIPLDILYEDEDIIVLNKAPGIVVHPAAGNWSHTLVNALLHHCTNLSGIGGEQRPGIVHRLDKDTSGCIVMAKNDTAHQDLSAQFAGREISKIYLAIVQGHLRRKTGVIEAAIGRHPVHRKKMAVVADAKGRASKTGYRVVQELADSSVVECTLHTGRTHQIRVHLKHLGHPLLGDALYGGKAGPMYPRQMLHAWKLGFRHPRTGKRVDFQSPVPRDFLDLGIKV